MSCIAHLPVHRGFTSSFGYLSGAEDHYADTRSGYVDLWRSSRAAYGENGSLAGGYDYNTYKFTREAVHIVEAHPAERPLFIYLAYQNVHGPIQAPDNYTALYDAEIYHPRLMCLAMIAAVDESIGKVTAALQSRGLWSDTLIIFSSDNVCTPLFCQPLFQLASNSASLVLWPQGGPADHANNWVSHRIPCHRL
jgi:arylsulfatase A-like enzyme